jgi:hypothetical protein
MGGLEARLKRLERKKGTGEEPDWHRRYCEDVLPYLRAVENYTRIQQGLEPIHDLEVRELDEEEGEEIRQICEEVDEYLC